MNIKQQLKGGRGVLFLYIFIGLFILAAAALCSINAYVKNSTKSDIYTPQEAGKLTNVDCILVLGCHVFENGRPSDMLLDRLQCGVNLYEQGTAPKLLMSGDHGQSNYDEVNVMKKYATDRGVNSSDVFMDHAGFSTYESMYRAKEIFKAKRIVIVTQKYHLYRALYTAKALGLEAYGVPCDTSIYYGQTKRDVREFLARNKDFFMSIFKPKPTYMGEAIPVSGDGDITNDKLKGRG